VVYTPRFEEAADSLILDNVMAIVKRDMKAALDHYYLSDSLPDFTERTLGRIFNLSFPTFSIDPDRHGSEESADGSYVEVDGYRANIFFAVQDADGPTATRLAQKYTRAMKSILRNASRADYLTGFPTASMLPLTVKLVTEYGLIEKQTDGYVKPVNIELTLNFNER
jgi:hypothetical protein